MLGAASLLRLLTGLKVEEYQNVMSGNVSTWKTFSMYLVTVVPKSVCELYHFRKIPFEIVSGAVQKLRNG